MPGGGPRDRAGGEGAGVGEGLPVVDEEIVEEGRREGGDGPALDAEPDAEPVGGRPGQVGLVVALRVEADGDGVDVAALPRGGPGDRAGVDPPAQEEAEGHVGDQAVAHALVEELEEPLAAALHGAGRLVDAVGGTSSAPRSRRLRARGGATPPGAARPRPRRRWCRARGGRSGGWTAPRAATCAAAARPRQRAGASARCRKRTHRRADRRRGASHRIGHGRATDRPSPCRRRRRRTSPRRGPAPRRPRAARGARAGPPCPSG